MVRKTVMPRLQTPYSFRWISWLRVPAAAPVERGRSGQFDGGLTAWCAEKSRSMELVELSKRIRVVWNGRMQTTAGRAWWPDRVIELNPKLREVAVEELWRTLKHELAHLVAYERSGRRHTEPHGPEWRAACVELGIPGEQPFHTLPFKRRRMKRNHVYVCPNCLVELRRVRPLQRVVACYACCRKYSGGQYDARFRLLAKARVEKGASA